MTFPFDPALPSMSSKPDRATATMADWQNWIAGLSRYERDQLYPGMHKDLIPAYEMIEAQEERKIAQFGPFVQNEGPNFDKSFNDVPGLSQPGRPDPWSAPGPDYDIGSASWFDRKFAKPSDHNAPVPPASNSGQLRTIRSDILNTSSEQVVPSKSSPTPGPGYDTPEAAARHIINQINPVSIARNQEFSGTIERIVSVTTGPDGLPVRTTKYLASSPSAGTGDHSVTRSYSHETSVGDYHTHGDYSIIGSNDQPERVSVEFDQRLRRKMDEYKSDAFTRQHRDYSWALAGETRMARAPYNEIYRSFLGTPSGRMRTHTPPQ